MKRPHKNTRGNHGSNRGRTDIPGRKWDRFGLYSDELEEIIDAEALLNTQTEVPRIPEMLPKLQTEEETITIKVKSIVKQIPDEIGAVLIDIADRRDIGSVNVIVSPQGRERQEIGAMTKTEELFSDGHEIGPNQMAEEASAGTLTEIREVSPQTTAANATMKGDLIVKPVPRPVIVDVSEETRTDEGTIGECTFDILGKNEMAKREVSTELLDISRQGIPQGFLELAEEAKLLGVRNTPSGIMTEVLPEIVEETGPTSDSISWKIEEGIEESAVSLGEVLHEVSSIRFDVGQLMRWPDRNSDDALICEFQLESELFFHGPARREAEPVFVVAESEVFTPVFAGGSLLSRTSRWWQRQLHREFLFCRRLEANSRPVCLRPLAKKTGGVRARVTFWTRLAMSLVGWMLVWFRGDIFCCSVKFILLCLLGCDRRSS